MIIIADSGSTKADWQIIKNGQIIMSVNTIGLNPFFHNAGNIYEEVKASFAEKINPMEVKAVF